MENNTDNFEDYLSEFNEAFHFDSEICPKCGLKMSDSISVTNSPYIDLMNTYDEKIAELVCTNLKNNKIDFLIYKEIDKSCLESIKYIFRIEVRIKDLDAAGYLIRENLPK